MQIGGNRSVAKTNVGRAAGISLWGGVTIP